MRESLPAVEAGERLLTGVDADVLLQVVLELERFPALGALELAERAAVVHPTAHGGTLQKTEHDIHSNMKFYLRFVIYPRISAEELVTEPPSTTQQA